MKSRLFRLALAFVLLAPCVSAQRGHISDSGDRLIHGPSFMGAHLSPETSRGLNGLPVSGNMSADFMPGSEGPGVKGSTLHAGRMISLQSRVSVIDTAIIQSTQDTTRHLYTFNANAQRTSDLTQKLVGGVWVNRSRVTDAFDAGGRLVSHLSEEWLSDQWMNSSRETNTYDAAGRQTSSLSEQWSGGQWVNVVLKTTAYDFGGRYTLYLVELWSGGQWVNGQRSTYSYDAAGRPLLGMWEAWANGQVSEYSLVTYAYDPNDHLQSVERVNRSGSVESTSRESYTYDAAGNRLSILNEQFWSGAWANRERKTYTYDATGNMLTRLDEKWSGSHWIGSHRYAFTYDANNRKLTESSEQYSEGQWPYLGRHIYTYDTDGNTLTDLYENWQYGHLNAAVYWANAYDGSGRKTSASYRGSWKGVTVDDRDSTMTYDANGRMLSQLYEERANGELVIGDRCEYAYDSEGRVTSLSHQSWLNSSWIPTDFTMWDGFRWDVALFEDGAGNHYEYSGYRFMFVYKVVLTGVAMEGSNLPAVYSLSQNYPNPFNPTTTIRFTIAGVVALSGSEGPATKVRLAVYDMLGREVAVLVDGQKEPGTYRIEFSGANLSTGVYICRMTAGGFAQSRTMLLLK